MTYLPQSNSPGSDLIKQAAFDYLTNTFAKNPAQPLVQPGQSKGGTVSQPNAPQSNAGNAAGIAKMLGIGGGAAGAGAAGGGAGAAGAF